MKTLIRPLIAAAALAALAGGASAQATTGSLAGWNVLGDVVTQAGALVLTTAYAEAGDPDQPFNLSGTSAIDITVIEPAAGLAPYALDLPEPEYAREGSLVTQSFAVAAGDTLRYSFSFSTAEDAFLDHAFVVLNGQVITLATRNFPGLPGAGHEYTFTSAGLVTLAFGVVDTGDYLGVSTLSISNLSVTAVPEPATTALWLAGLGLVAGAARRRR
ncbi:MAG: PEP-CTERM sorting domain-containing protein [Rubrivivax sp.]|nr:PEP-CTERM sorting domain-containing protein [Rubrivivax sp.]